MPRTVLLALCCLTSGSLLRAEEAGTSGFVDSGGVKIHYRTQGKGPLCILLHGFPDYSYTWHKQMPVLAKSFQVVAIDFAATTVRTSRRRSRTTPWTSSSATWPPW